MEPAQERQGPASYSENDILPRPRRRSASAAGGLPPVVDALLGPDAPLHLTCWDGSSIGDPSSALRIHFNSADAVRRLIWAPGELGLSRAYVAGDIEVDGSSSTCSPSGIGWRSPTSIPESA